MSMRVRDSEEGRNTHHVSQRVNQIDLPLQTHQIVDHDWTVPPEVVRDDPADRMPDQERREKYAYRDWHLAQDSRIVGAAEALVRLARGGVFPCRGAGRVMDDLCKALRRIRQTQGDGHAGRFKVSKYTNADQRGSRTHLERRKSSEDR